MCMKFKKYQNQVFDKLIQVLYTLNNPLYNSNQLLLSLFLKLTLISSKS